MTDPITAALAIIALLQIKHFIFDFPAQTAYQLNNKGCYGHLGGMIHAALHVVGTMAIFLVVTPTLLVAATIIVGEFVVHYHVDWLKDKAVRIAGWTTADNGFWWALGADQLAHQVTYIVIAGSLVSVTIGG